MAASFPNPEMPLSDAASQPDDQLLSIPKTSSSIQSSNDIMTPEQSSDDEMSAVETPQNNVADVRTKISHLLKDKEQEWTALARKEGPLRLLDLPLDVLKEIVKEASTSSISYLMIYRVHRRHLLILLFFVGYSYKRFDSSGSYSFRTPQPCHTPHIL
jgi:hypothetical protein